VGVGVEVEESGSGCRVMEEDMEGEHGEGGREEDGE
jgi:hypothetical protein